MIKQLYIATQRNNNKYRKSFYSSFTLRVLGKRGFNKTDKWKSSVSYESFLLSVYFQVDPKVTTMYYFIENPVLVVIHPHI